MKFEPIKTLMNIIEVEQPGIPLILKIIAKKPVLNMEAGSAETWQSNEVYVCLSQLPDELRERIKTYVQVSLR
jgi:hypothetical protein